MIKDAVWMWWRTLLRKTGDDAQRQPARAADAGHDATAKPRAAVRAEGRAGQRAGRAARRGGAPAGLMETDLQRLANACNKAAQHYCENPNAAGPETVVDIYLAMAALASMLDNQMKTQPLLQKRLH